MHEAEVIDGGLQFTWGKEDRNSTFMDFIKTRSSFNDVTLVSDDQREFYCHKMILSACSTFFENILTRQSQSNLVLFLSGIRSEDLENIINFVYEGFVNVSMADVKSFITASNVLGIKGIIEVEMEDTIEKEKKTTKKKRRNKKSDKIVIDSSKEDEYLFEEPNSISSGENPNLIDEAPEVEDKVGVEVEADKTVDAEANSTSHQNNTSKQEKLKEVQSKFSKEEILKAYRMMKQMKQNVKSEESETVNKEDTAEDLKNSKLKIKNSNLFTVKKERQCDLCDYTTTDSSNFKRHVSKRHSASN